MEATRTGTLTARPLAWLLAAAAFAAALLLAPNSAEAFVYWANFGGGTGSTIGRANLDGSGAQQDLLSGASGPCGVAVDSGHLYWGNEGSGAGLTIGRANLDGSGAQQAFVSGAASPCGVAVDADFLYWANAATGSIGRADLDGSAPDQTFIAPTGGVCGVAVTPDGKHVFWGNPDQNAIGRAKIDGTGADPTFIGGADEPCGVAVNGAHVYWANFGGGFGTTIGRANLDGSAADQGFVTGSEAPCGVAVDDKHVYWANATGNTVGRARLNGTGAEQGFVATNPAPCGVAVDGLLRSAEAQVDCLPGEVGRSQPTTCEATVADAAGGPPSAPTGSVSFASGASGATFESSTCELVPGALESSCSVTYRPGLGGTQIVLGVYGGDVRHTGTTATGSLEVSSLALGSLRRNRRRGTATLTAELPGPGRARIRGGRIRNFSRSAESAGDLGLKVRPRHGLRQQLKRKRRARVAVEVTFTPTGGGNQEVETTKIKLVRRK